MSAADRSTLSAKPLESTIVAIIPSVEEAYAQRNAIKALPVRFLVLKNALFKSTAVASHGFKAPLIGVHHFHELEAKRAYNKRH